MKTCLKLSYKTPHRSQLISLNLRIINNKKEFGILHWSENAHFCIHSVCWIIWYLKDDRSKWYIDPYYINIVI